AVIVPREMIEVSQELNRGDGARELGRDPEHQIDERSAKRLQVLGRERLAAQRFQPARQQRIETDRGAVRLERRLVVDVNFVRFDLAQVLRRELFTEKFTDLSLNEGAVDLDVDVLVDFGL